MSVTEFALPDVGEGLTEAEIVSWCVAEGDEIALNAPLCEIETAKSVVELPSPVAGTVRELRVAVGDVVPVGSVIAVIGGNGDDVAAPIDPDVSQAVRDAQASISNEPREGAPARGADCTPHRAGRREAPGSSGQGGDEGSGAVLVGYGVAKPPSSRRRGRVGVPRENAAAAARTNARAVETVPASLALPVIAKPPIRKLARDLGVDLTTVEPTGLAGETTREDIIRHAEQAKVFKNLETPDPEPETAREEVVPVKGVRKAIATAMVNSMFSAPHVTLFVDVDASRTMEFVQRLKSSPDFAGVKVSPLLIVAKAVMWAIRRNPTVNATWTDEAYTLKHYVNLGLAAATPRGLLVPNIKNAHDMSLKELAQTIEQLTLRARDGKTPPSEQQGGTFTITNIGVFGMDSGTPILNPGEVGILALGTIKPKPWVVGDEVRVRQVTTLTASFDHRLVDGDVASRFLADVARIVEEPALLLD